MNLIILMITMSSLISSIIFMITWIIGKKTLMDQEKKSPFECGYDPKGKSRTPFSLRFFLVCLIFIIFDIEIALILPLGMLSMSSSIHFVLMTSLFIMTILIIGLFHEWNQGSLNWTM